MVRRVCAFALACAVLLVAPPFSVAFARSTSEVVEDLRSAASHREAIEGDLDRLEDDLARRRAIHREARSAGARIQASIADTTDGLRAVERRQERIEQEVIDAAVASGTARQSAEVERETDQARRRLAHQRLELGTRRDALYEAERAAAARVAAAAESVAKAKRALADRREDWDDVNRRILRLSEERAAAEAAARRASEGRTKKGKGKGKGAKAPDDPNRFGRPHPGVITSTFGPRWGRPHQGVDIDGVTGEPIGAARPGTVATAGVLAGYGNVVTVDHGGGVTSLYAHLSEIGVAPGQAVTKGARLGALGCTGRCYGDHLHFEIRIHGAPVDPLLHIPA